MVLLMGHLIVPLIINIMARRKLEERNIRKLSKKGPSYFITLPIEGIRELGWQKGQKLVADVDVKRNKIVIKDWE